LTFKIKDQKKLFYLLSFDFPFICISHPCTGSYLDWDWGYVEGLGEDGRAQEEGGAEYRGGNM